MESSNPFFEEEEEEKVDEEEKGEEAQSEEELDEFDLPDWLAELSDDLEVRAWQSVQCCYMSMPWYRYLGMDRYKNRLRYMNRLWYMGLRPNPKTNNYNNKVNWKRIFYWPPRVP